MSNTTGRICPRGASYYIWQAGDTLDSVAHANNITVQSIRILNEDINFATVAAGDAICLPPQQLTCVSGERYTIQAGDTFNSIAQKFGITTIELAERNPYVIPNNLLVGQVICVPSQSGGAAGATGSTGTIGISCPLGSTPSRIARGQTFADLLIANDVSYRAMRLYNPQLNPEALMVGQYYCAPPAGARGLCPNGSQTYVIQANETLDFLAAKFATTQGVLLQLNSRMAPSDFKAGQTICVPT